VTAACHLCRELIGGYVLDALEPAERDMVRQHLETCEPCAREHAELATLPSLLDVADSADAVPLRPPPRLEEAVLDRFARELRGIDVGGAPVRDDAEGAPPPRRRWRPGRRARWLAPALAAMACALAVAVAVVAFTGSGDDGAGGRRVYQVSMTATGPAPMAAGEARLYPGDDGTGVHLEVSGLKPNAYDYELWCVRDDGWKISAGTFRVDSKGRADIHMSTAAKPTEYDGLTVQAKPRVSNGDVHPVRVLSGRFRS
jgi:hypothetical protein